MSKKTNKTDHVLNLLSSGVKKTQEEPEKQETPAKVSVVHTGGDQVAETIRKNLEEELEKVKEEQQEEEKKEEQREKLQEKQQETVPAQTEKDAKSEKEEQQTEDTEDDFVIVNVMERLVRQRAPEYIKQFHICGCRRCLADVTALSLTGLPAKYVVINRNAISPLMNFYTMKYAGRVTVEVTKACIAVQAEPHHKIEEAE